MAESTSASSNTINGALPPSSKDTFFSVGAHCCINNLPTGVEPVKVSLRTVGLLVISAPIGRDWPVTTLNTPAGTPASSASTARARAEKGVSEAGRATKPQPAASAGPHLRVIMADGKFQGVIAATTPIGSLVTTTRASALCVGIMSP